MNFMDLAQNIVIGVATPVGVWLGARRLSAANARKVDRDGDREDFKTYRETWEKERAEMRDEISGLRDEVSALRDETAETKVLLLDEQRDSEALVEALRMLLAWFAAQFPDHKPPLLPLRVQQRLNEIV